MSARLIEVTASAYQYPLLIKHLLHSSMLHAADQEIVYRDQKRFTYRMLRDRIGRLASGLKELGVRPGDTVGVMDWDTQRFLEAFFAIPMMGAILQTVNIRLSPEQILYTIEHSGATTLLVNDEFLPLLAAIRPSLSKVRTIVVMSDNNSFVVREEGVAGALSRSRILLVNRAAHSKTAPRKINHLEPSTWEWKSAENGLFLANVTMPLRTFPTVLWAQTVFHDAKPMVPFTAEAEAQTAPKVKF